MGRPGSKFTLFLAIATLVITRAAAGDALFAGATFPIEGFPADLVAGDFDGNGAVDVAVAHSQNGGLSVLLGSGDGAFEEPSVLAADPGAERIVAADFDGDGALDLAVANFRENEVHVRLGSGDGSFQAPVLVATGVPAAALAAADFDGNGVVDLVAAGEFQGVLLIGDGSGHFDAPRFFDAGIDSSAIAVGDLDGDGRLDLVATGFSSALAVILGNPEGFDPPVLVEGNGGRLVSIADLDGDGALDLVSASTVFQGAGLTLRFGNGDGTFAPPIVQPTVEFPTALAIHDFDGDGAPDLAVSGGTFAHNTLEVLLGDGEGGFARSHGSNPHSNIRALAVADVDGDAQGDLILAIGILGNQPGLAGDLTVLFGDGDGTFPVGAFPTAQQAPSDLAIADLDEDGRVDLVTADFGFAASGLSALLGRGERSFADPFGIATTGRPRQVVAGDLDGDGVTDLVSSGGVAPSPSFIDVVLGLGGGDFATPASFPFSPDPSTIALDDLDGDGVLDLIVKARDGAHVLLGDGGGGFGPGDLVAPFFFGAALAIDDLDGDGARDLVFSGISEIAVFLGAGDGTFASGERIPFTSRSPRARTGDLDGDGVPDLAVALTRPSELQILRGNGDGTFEPAGAPPIPLPPVDTAISDVDRDGVSDLIVLSAVQGRSWIVLLLGHGDGGFDEPRVFRAGSEVSAFAVTDVDGDGAPDLVATNQGSHLVTVLFQRAPGVAEVAIDVRPGDARNHVDPFGHAALPVALLGAEDFDVTRVDEASLALGPDAAALLGRALRLDVDRDGFPDLLLRFRGGDVGIAFGDTEVCLTGTTLDGQAFAGCDAIRLVGFVGACGLGFEVSLLLPAWLWLRRRSHSRR